MHTMTLQLDDGDYAAVQAAIARRQRCRADDNSPLLPPTESCTAGANIAEICRGWLDDRDQRKATDYT